MPNGETSYASLQELVDAVARHAERIWCENDIPGSCSLDLSSSVPQDENPTALPQESTVTLSIEQFNGLVTTLQKIYQLSEAGVAKALIPSISNSSLIDSIGSSDHNPPSNATAQPTMEFSKDTLATLVNNISKNTEECWEEATSPPDISLSYSNADKNRYSFWGNANNKNFDNVSNNSAPPVFVKK